METEQVRFETWCKTDQNLDIKRAKDHDGYYWPDINFAWQVWQSAVASSAQNKTAPAD